MNMSETNPKGSYKQVSSRGKKIKEQQLLFSAETFLPAGLPSGDELRPATNLSAIFDECHNYIYANEGLLKDKIFHEMVKLLMIKLYDEQHNARHNLQFGLTAGEYKAVLANRSGDFEQRMAKLFQTVRTEYPSFFSDAAFKLKPLTLAYVVGRLQYLSLSQTAGDVKGEAFQTFIYRHQRGDRGEFFTPHPIVRMAVEMIAPQPHETIIDPACGSGGFLLQAISYSRNHYPYLDKAGYVQRQIRAIEFNPDVALAAMIRLAFEGGVGSELLCANGLLNNESLQQTFDIVLTNPPFGSKGKVEDPQILKFYLLARKWRKTGPDQWEITPNVLAGQSPDILFIEKCLNLLRPGGRMAIVLPDGLLQNISNSHIRFWIRSQAKVLGVVSIPQEAFIPYGTGIKTSLLLLQKLPAATNHLFMAHIQKIGYDVKGQPLYKRDENGKWLKTPAGTPLIDDDIDQISQAYKQFQAGQRHFENTTTYTVPEPMLNARLDVEHYLPDDYKLLDHLQRQGAKPLADLATILSETDNFRATNDSDIRYIAISDVDAQTMQVVSQQIVKPYDAPSRATYRLRQGDILTAVSGASTGTPRQATVFITEDEEGAICTNGFAVLRHIKGVDPLFLLAYMRTGYYLRQVRRLMTGHAIPAISTEDLAKVLIPIPPLTVQKKIADEIRALLTMRREALKAGQKIVRETESLVGQLG